jgi:putative phosphoesterase
MATRVGVISDTHGLLRPEAVAALKGSHVIVHAGDVGRPEVLDGLSEIAPIWAVRGNIDTEAWAMKLPATEAVKVGSLVLWVLHNSSELDLDPVAANFAAVICGHSHKPSIETRDRVLYLNPGSAGPRRFRLPVTVARLRIVGTSIDPEIVELDV